MRILDRYISREVISHSLLGLAVFTFVFFIPQLVRLMSLIIQHSASWGQTAELIFCSLPPVMIFTVPISMLVGVLIGLGRLSADSEIIALNASGVSLRRLLVPIIAIAAIGSGITLGITGWAGPASIRVLRSVENHLRSTEAPAAIEPRVFDERFPHIVLYVQDVAASGSRWRGVFLAQSDSEGISSVTLAKSALVDPDPGDNKLVLQFNDVSTHEFDPARPDHYNLSSAATESVALSLTNSQAASAASRQRSARELPLSALLSITGPEQRDARVEFQQRIALPAACLLFALLGVPVGVRPRRGGRAAGFILAILLICAYYLIFVSGVHLAQQGAISPGLGVWAANIVTFIAALLLLAQVERVRSEATIFGQTFSQAFLRLRYIFSRRSVAQRLAANYTSAGAASDGRTIQFNHQRPARYRTSAFPLILDLYLLRTFFYWLVLMLIAFMILFDAFTLFDLLGDISRNHVSPFVVMNYFAHLLPMMLYQLLPLAALVATLITIGLLAKNNEVTALKASGVSLFRLSVPLLIAGLLLAGGMFLLDDTFLPYANQRQDALRDQIKGRPAQTYFQFSHQWIFGEGGRVYNYEFFDPYRNLFGGLNVFEIDLATFQVRRRIYAGRAYWEPALGAWILEQGWTRDFSADGAVHYEPFRVDSQPELQEAPSYFKREVFPAYQMNWRRLGNYIQGLQKAGFDTSRLSVEWHRKFAFPLITAIIMFLAIPFAFLVGTRGAIGGLALAVGIGIVYWAAAALFQAMGSVGQLPPFVAGWAPDAIFGFLGLYFFLKMPT